MTKEEDSPIALLNRFFANGEAHIAETLELPALSPAIVMLSLSPPKLEAFSLIHFKAKIQKH